MNDEPVLEYLQTRGRATPPPTLVDDVLRALDEAPPGRLWFLAFAPVGVAAAIVLLVAGSAFLLSLRPDMTTPPTDAESTTDAASASASATPTPRADAEPITEEGATTTIAAVADGREWGTIRLRRGQDTGGYRAVANVDLPVDATDPSPLYFQNDPDAFYLEVFVDYQPEGNPGSVRVGVSDWELRVSGAGSVDPISPLNLDKDLLVGGPQPQLGIWDSGVVVLDSEALDGWLVFAVPRDVADRELGLVYRPAGADRTIAASIPVRTPGAPPDSVPSVVPPAPPDYIGVARLPITVAGHAEADALFANPDTCTNPVAGYTVTFPDSWWTNTAVGDVPACTWFSPAFFEVTSTEGTPEGVAIALGYVDGVGGIGGLGHGLSAEALTIDGRAASRSEQVGVGGGFIDIGSFHYGYVVAVEGQFPSEDDSAAVVMASTTWQIEDDPAAYELSRAVLDRIMASMEFEGEGRAFSVIASPVADALFRLADRCTNPVEGYAVSFPDEWYTNTTVGDVPACSWFTPERFVVDGTQAPDEIWISIGVVDGTVGYTSLTEVHRGDELLVDGIAGHRAAFTPREPEPEPDAEPDETTYWYVLYLEGEVSGPTFVALVSTATASDYELGKAVLDRITASLEFTQ